MGCFTDVKDGMKIAPLARMPVVRDLVIDRTAFFETLRELQLYIPEQKDILEPQTLIEPDEHVKLVGCLECLACNATCPCFDFARNAFPGPYMFVKLAQLHFDPRNTLDRRRQARDLGIETCADCGKCYCIHGINIKRDAIGTLLPQSAPRT
jgi:succinate dehydrogenase/fumarate reductase iron-sulfur protein